jgi:hypothetical protein
MTKRNYDITTDKKLKGKHKITIESKNIANPQLAKIKKIKKEIRKKREGR